MASRSRFGRGRSSHARIPGAVVPAVPRSRALSVAPKASRVGCAIAFRGGAPALTCGRTDAETDRSGAESRRIHAGHVAVSPVPAHISGSRRAFRNETAPVRAFGFGVAEMLRGRRRDDSGSAAEQPNRVAHLVTHPSLARQSPVTRRRWPAARTTPRRGRGFASAGRVDLPPRHGHRQRPRSGPPSAPSRSDARPVP